MSQDDPFAIPGDDRTIIMPSPGARHPPTPPRGTPTAWPAIADEPISATGLNPLLAAANSLLNIVPQLRVTLRHSDPSGLRNMLADGIRDFERRAKASSVPPEKVIAARYALCTLLDETAASTPWGGSGIWAKHSLLVMFQNEAYGGEKLFQLLAKLAENPGANQDVLELIYVCLALGFEGRYRVIENGRQQLEAVRERLAQLIRKQRGDYERDLSPHWPGVQAKRHALFSSLPLWVAGSLAAAVLTVAYVLFNLSLNKMSDPLFAAIQDIRVQAPAERRLPPAPTSPPATTKSGLIGFLEPEIKTGLVAVREDGNRTIVTVRGDGLFAPGSTTVGGQLRSVVERIAAALATETGKVVVTGHTDSQPIHSVRFPSNWHLSQERARAVAQLLVATLPAARVSSEGRADGEPIASNDTAEGRAKNRRVEITLFRQPRSS